MTIIGQVLLETCCDACQTPVRAMIADNTPVESVSAGLAMYSAFSGAGGILGHIIIIGTSIYFQ